MTVDEPDRSMVSETGRPEVTLNVTVFSRRSFPIKLWICDGLSVSSWKRSTVPSFQ